MLIRRIFSLRPQGSARAIIVESTEKKRRIDGERRILSEWRSITGPVTVSYGRVPNSEIAAPETLYSS